MANNNVTNLTEWRIRKAVTELDVYARRIAADSLQVLILVERIQGTLAPPSPRR